MSTKNHSFESVVLSVAENITDTATAKAEKNSSVSIALSDTNKQAVEQNGSISKYTINKSKNTLCLVLTPEFKMGVLSSIYKKPVEEIEQVAFKHRKNIAVSMAIDKITKLHLSDEKFLVEYIANATA